MKRFLLLLSFNPLNSGATHSTLKHFDARLPLMVWVSIPSIAGQRIRPERFRHLEADRLAAQVSIPSIAGQRIRRIAPREPRRGVVPQPGFNPLNSGATHSTWRRAARSATACCAFQSPQ